MDQVQPNTLYEETKGVARRVPAGRDKKGFTAQRILLLGRSGVGKTYAGCRYLLDLIKAGIFSPRRVVIVSKTWKSDDSQKDLIKYCQKAYDGFTKNNCFEDIDVEFLRKLFDGQKMIKDTRPQDLHNWMIFFDDQISSALIKRQDKDPTLKLLFCVGRHYAISQVWCLQRFKATLDPTCRDQFTMLVIFRQGNKAALKDLLADYDESPNNDAKESLNELYAHYLDAIEDQDGHGALVINVLTSYGAGRLQKNLGGTVFYDKKN